MKKPKKGKTETLEEWRARALRSQARVVLGVLRRGGQTLEQIREDVNRLGHDFTPEHVLASLHSLRDDGIKLRFSCARGVVWYR